MNRKMKMRRTEWSSQTHSEDPNSKMKTKPNPDNNKQLSQTFFLKFLYPSTLNSNLSSQPSTSNQNQSNSSNPTSNRPPITVIHPESSVDLQAIVSEGRFTIQHSKQFPQGHIRISPQTHDDWRVLTSCFLQNQRHFIISKINGMFRKKNETVPTPLFL